MDLKTALFLLSDLILILAGYIYGWKLLKKENYLLGLEWWIIGISASNLFISALTGTQVCYEISMFLDTFSRAFGFPVIAIIGTMAVTHQYRPSKLADTLIFVLSFVCAGFLMYQDSLQPAKPYLLLLASCVFAIFLVYLVVRLLRAGQRTHALNVLAILVTTMAIAVIDDFYTLPGDPDKTIFYTIAMAVWAYMLVGYYYAYCALERAEKS